VANVQDGFLDLRQIKMVRVDPDKAGRYALQRGDVLVTEGGDFDKLGRGFVWKGEIEGCLHQNHIFAIRPDHERLDPHFLALLMSSRYGRLYFLSCAKKSTNLASINSTELKRFLIPLPSIHEQRCISSAISLWERAEFQTMALVENKETLKRGLMQLLLTGKCRHPSYAPAARRTYYLGQLFSQRNETNRPDLPLLAITSDRGIVSRNEIERRDSSSDDKRAYQKIAAGDIGYNTMRMWQGVSALSTLEGIVSPAYTVCIPTDQIHGGFAAYLFKFPPVINLFHRYSQGLVADTLALKFSNFVQIRVTVPPLEEQQWIFKVLQNTDRQLDLLRHQLTCLRSQKKAMIQKLLTGEIRTSGIRAGTKSAAAKSSRRNSPKPLASLSRG
jgi:type I restriction enzyme S subunit